MNIIVDKVLARTSQIIGMQRPQLRHAMGVFAIYQELADAGFDVRAEHFSLLELLVKSRAMASEYFGFNSEQLTVFDDGLEKINEFFVADTRIIKNPQDFNKIKRVFTKGSIDELDLIRSGDRSVDNVIRDIKDRAKHSNFLDTLRGVRDTLERLPISSFRDTDSEALAVMSLQRLIDKKFVPIALQHLGIDE